MQNTGLCPALIRYDKTADSFLDFIGIACIKLWLRPCSIRAGCTGRCLRPPGSRCANVRIVFRLEPASKIIRQKDASKMFCAEGAARLSRKPQMQSFLVLFGGQTASPLLGHASGLDLLSSLLILPVHGQELRVLFQEAAPTRRFCSNLPFWGVPDALHGAPVVRVPVRSGGTLWPVRRGQSRMCHPHFLSLIHI